MKPVTSLMESLMEQCWFGITTSKVRFNCIIFSFTGIIKLKNNGDFVITNEGRRPIYIDGRPVLSGNKWKLNNNSVVEVCGLSL